MGSLVLALDARNRLLGKKNDSQPDPQSKGSGWMGSLERLRRWGRGSNLTWRSSAVSRLGRIVSRGTKGVQRLGTQVTPGVF